MKIPYHGAGILFYHLDTKGNLSVFLGKKSYQGKEWSVFGGGWEEKDGYLGKEKNLLKTAIREAKEEMGLTIPENIPKKLWEKHLGVYNWVTFAVRLREKKRYRTSGEIQEVGWFPVAELPHPSPLYLRQQVAELKSGIEKHIIEKREK